MPIFLFLCFPFYFIYSVLKSIDQLGEGEFDYGEDGEGEGFFDYDEDEDFYDEDDEDDEDDSDIGHFTSSFVILGPDGKPLSSGNLGGKNADSNTTNKGHKSQVSPPSKPPAKTSQVLSKSTMKAPQAPSKSKSPAVAQPAKRRITSIQPASTKKSRK